MKRNSETPQPSGSNTDDNKKRRKRSYSKQGRLKLDAETERMVTETPPEEVEEKIRQVDNEIVAMRQQLRSLESERNTVILNLRRNLFIKDLLCQPPFLIGTVNELWNQEEEDGDSENVEAEDRVQEGPVSSIVALSRRKMYFPNTGLVNPENITPGQEVCLHPWSNVVLDTLPETCTIDWNVRALEVVDEPTDKFSDIGGLEKEIIELKEAVELPITAGEKFQKVGTEAPKGVLLYGAPGTGKTLLARACAAEINARFISLNATILNRSYIGEGSKIVREMFRLAKNKVPCIIFIDEIDAIGSIRAGPLRSTDREIYSTMTELLNQMDGFTRFQGVTVIAATNRLESLDPALLRSGRFDRKIMIPEPNEVARLKILLIHSRNMRLDDTVDLEDISRMTEGFSAVMCRAVCAEAAMSSIRRNSTSVCQEDMYIGVAEISTRRVPKDPTAAFS